jgi:4-amino-4-deoxy-L-arabinose transferase-like glycosyltransferase
MNTAPEVPSMNKDDEGHSREWMVLAGLAAYFLVSILLRVVISGTADMDETENLIYTQALRLGYGAQLPLYAWLQYLIFTLVGTNIFAMSLLKYTLLFSTYVCVFKVAQMALRDSMGATTAVFSLFLIPQIVWESYRTLTNTVLATLMAAATLLILLRLREKPVTANYLFLGAGIGLGMLSKYNYAIFIVSVLVACVSIPSFRRCLLSVKIFMSLCVAAAITTPPYVWIVTNLDQATASSKKLKALEQGNFITDLLVGLLSLAASWVGYFWPGLLVYGLLYIFFKPVRKTFPDDEIQQLLKRSLLAAFSICIILILLFKVTYFKERWMQPLLFFLPIFFMHYLAPKLNQKRFRGIVATTLVPALLAMLLFSGGVLFASRAERATRLSPPYRSMALKIQGKGFTGGTIITNDHRIGGNFRLHFKESNVLVTRMPQVPFGASDPTLILWNADKSELPPEELKEFSEQLLHTSLNNLQTVYVEEPLLYWPDETMTLGYILINGGG